MGERESKVQRGDVDGKVKGGGRGGEGQKKRGGEKPGRKDIRARKQKRGRKEEGDVIPVQKKIRQKVRARKVQVRGEKREEEELGLEFQGSYLR